MNEQTSVRLQKLRNQMQQEGVDLIALAPGAHMQWLIDFYPHPDERPCLLLIGPESETFLMPALNAEDTRARSDIQMIIWKDASGPAQALESALDTISASNARCISLDETMRADFALPLVQALPHAQTCFTENTVGWLRMQKDANECALLRQNARIADKAMLTAMENIAVGKSEIEIAKIVQETFSENGAQMQFAIVGSGPNGALPHHSTGTRTLQRGDAVVIDIGGKQNSFNSDITRMAIVGELPENFHQVHSIVNEAVKSALATAVPGVRACVVDNAARDVIANSGYGEYFVHRTGHGLGLEVHEPPYIMSSSEIILEEGMVFSIEPGIYLPGKFGIRLEEIIILQKDGPEILSQLSRDYVICDNN